MVKSGFNFEENNIYGTLASEQFILAINNDSNIAIFTELEKDADDFDSMTIIDICEEGRIIGLNLLDSQVVLTVTSKGTIIIFDIFSKEILAKMELQTNDYALTMTVSRDRSHLAISTNTGCIIQDKDQKQIFWVKIQKSGKKYALIFLGFIDRINTATIIDMTFQASSLYEGPPLLFTVSCNTKKRRIQCFYLDKNHVMKEIEYLVNLEKSQESWSITSYESRVYALSCYGDLTIIKI